MTHNKPMRIILAGGGTMGPVSPLLAVAEFIKHEHSNAEFLFIGTSVGPEQRAAENAVINFRSVPAGKLRRYWSWANLLTPFLLSAGLVKALYLLLQFKPTCVFGAGGFVQVPVMYAAWILRIPRVIHQQDVEVTLSNSICAPIASKITVSLEHSLRDFHQGSGFFSNNESKLIWTGNPVRASLLKANREEALKFFGLSSNLPIVLITGGSSGAKRLNELIWQALPELTRIAQIIHTVGINGEQKKGITNYYPFKFLDRMDFALSASDAVVSRAGLSAISELIVLKKPAVIIPMPYTHQESNAALLWDRKAAIVLDQTSLEPQELVSEIHKLLIDGQLAAQLSQNLHALMPTDATKKIADIIYNLHK